MGSLIHSLREDLESLSIYFDLWVDDAYHFVIVQSVRLPFGYSYEKIDLLLELPADYPLSPPGVGDARVFCAQRTAFLWQSPGGRS